MSNFTEVADLDCSVTTALGGTDKKTAKANPTCIEGYYIGTRQVVSPKSKTGFASLHVLQTQKGNVGVWGKTNLDQKMLAAKPGQMIRATFVGMVPTKNNPMYKYKLEIDANNTIDVASVEDSGAAAGDYTAEKNTDAEGGDYGSDDAALDADDTPADVVPPTRAAPPRTAAKAPDAARQAKVNALLAGRRTG